MIDRIDSQRLLDDEVRATYGRGDYVGDLVRVSSKAALAMDEIPVKIRCTSSEAGDWISDLSLSREPVCSSSLLRERPARQISDQHATVSQLLAMLAHLLRVTRITLDPGSVRRATKGR